MHIYRAGTAFVNFGSVVSSGGPDNTGIRSEEGNLQNMGDITIYNGTGIESTGSYTINAGTINNKGPESKGISSYSSRIDNTGRIAGDGTGIDMKDNSILLNDGVIEAFGTGTGVISTGSFILNSKGGIISSEYNSGISAFDSLYDFIVDFHRSISDRHHIILSEYCLRQTCCNCQSVLRLQILIQKIARDLRSTDPAEYGMYTAV